jgi:tRNA A-37 threonylcarbamoyl transferase component Bud32
MPAGDSLIQNREELNELKPQIIELACHTAGSAQVTAISLNNNYPTNTENGKAVIEVVVVVKDFQPRLLSYFKNINGRNVIIFAVDQWIFERDVDRGFLGEAVASKLIFPYSTLQGETYLHHQEVTLKKRLILESLENLAIGYPELVYHLQLKPQYFLYDVLINRIRVFPLFAYELSDMLEGSALRDEEKALKSYNEALNQLEREEVITRLDGCVTVSKKFAVQSQKPRVRLTNLTKNAPRTLFTSFFGVFPQLLNIVGQNTQAFLKTQKINLRFQPDINPNCYAIDPQKYAFVPTLAGLVSLADKVNISGFAQKMFQNSNPESVTFEPIGGVLNDIYLIKAQVNGVEKKVLVKRFKEWSGFKWFPLSLWSFGARAFAVSGKARLAKECATSEFLRTHGFNVPKILHVSTAERLIFMDFIEGEDLSHSIKRLAFEPDSVNAQYELAKIETAGELMAKVHSFDMTLGDTKPENVMVSKDGTVYLLDFEQATQDGDKAWDIAEFLYYAGHYLQPLSSNGTAEAIAEAFIKGYLRAGGDIGYVKKAESAKYTRVFSVFTMPSIILAIANTIKKTPP